jgi:hypothetical protein
MFLKISRCIVLVNCREHIVLDASTIYCRTSSGDVVLETNLNKKNGLDIHRLNRETFRKYYIYLFDDHQSTTYRFFLYCQQRLVAVCQQVSYKNNFTFLTGKKRRR